MGKNFEQKMAIVKSVKERLSSTQLLFSLEASGVRLTLLALYLSIWPSPVRRARALSRSNVDGFAPNEHPHVKLGK